MPRNNDRPSTSIVLATLICGLGLIAGYKLFPDFWTLGFVITVLVTTTIVIHGFDRQVTRFDYLPFFEMSYKAVPISAFIVGAWILLGGLWSNDPFVVVAMLFGLLYSVILAIPCCIAYVAIRKHFRPVHSDTFVRCRQCEYRVDNLAGPFCPECGLAFKDDPMTV